MSSNSPPGPRNTVLRTFVFSMYACSTSVASSPSTTKAPPSHDRGAARGKLEVEPRPAHPLHRPVPEECAVRAIADDAEGVCHARSYSPTRRLYLPVCPRLSREARRRHTSIAAFAIVSALVIASCGGDDDDATDDAATTEADAGAAATTAAAAETTEAAAETTEAAAETTEGTAPTASCRRRWVAAPISSSSRLTAPRRARST